MQEALEAAQSSLEPKGHLPNIAIVWGSCLFVFTCVNVHGHLTIVPRGEWVWLAPPPWGTLLPDSKAQKSPQTKVFLALWAPAILH